MRNSINVTKLIKVCKHIRKSKFSSSYSIFDFRCIPYTAEKVLVFRIFQIRTRKTRARKTIRTRNMKISKYGHFSPSG